MNKIRSYTNVWTAEKALYSINDMNLPFPITFSQMTWFVVSLLAAQRLEIVTPLFLIDGIFLNFFGIIFIITL